MLIAGITLLVLGSIYWEVTWALNGFPFPRGAVDKTLLLLVNFFWFSLVYEILRRIASRPDTHASKNSN